MAKKYLDFEGLSHFKGKLDVVLAAIVEQMGERLVEMYYTKGEVDVLIDDLQFGIMKKVDALPAVGEENIIYLVPKVAPATGFDEYIWLADEQDYELIGTTNIDLSDYYTKSEVDTKVAAETTRATTAEGNLNTIKANKSEMTVVAGTGANADKTTITLKSGTSATVLTQHQDISGKEDKVEVVSYADNATINAQVGKYYKGGQSATFNLPTITDTTKVCGFVVSITTSWHPNITFVPPTGVEIDYFAGYSIDAYTKYELNLIFNGTKWILAYGIIG